MDKSIEEAIRPRHYKQGKVECIEAVESAFGVRDTMAFCKICAFKYVWRLGDKDEEEKEIGKAKWHLDKYLELKGRA